MQVERSLETSYSAGPLSGTRHLFSLKATKTSVTCPTPACNTRLSGADQLCIDIADRAAARAAVELQGALLCLAEGSVAGASEHTAGVGSRRADLAAFAAAREGAPREITCCTPTQHRSMISSVLEAFGYSNTSNQLRLHIMVQAGHGL